MKIKQLIKQLIDCNNLDDEVVLGIQQETGAYKYYDSITIVDYNPMENTVGLVSFLPADAEEKK